MRAFKYYLIFILSLGCFISCVKTDDFDLPEFDDSNFEFEGATTTISSVKGHYNMETEEIYTFQNTGVAMEGYVVSSDEAGNFYKELILQDRASEPTAGIQVLVDDNALFTTYEFGRKVFIKLDGLSLGFNHGVLQLGIQNRGDVVAIPRALIEDHIIRTSEKLPIEPLRVEIDNFSDQYKNLYILLDNVQFDRNLVRDEKRFSFASETTDEFDGIRQLESCESGATTMVSTSTFADFRSLLIPQTSGSVEGVLTRDFYDDFYNLVINNPEAIKFGEGERCDPDFLFCGENSSPGIETIFEEGFETITTLRMLETRGWTNKNVSGGSELFKPGTLTGNRHVRISAYNTVENSIEAWLVTPPIDLTTSSNEVLSVDLRSSFDNATILRVLVTTNFTGNPLTTDWTLVEAKIPVGPSNQNAAQFLRSHIDISCLEGTVHIGFHYQGGSAEKTTTYDIDNIRVTGAAF